MLLCGILQSIWRVHSKVSDIMLSNMMLLCAGSYYVTWGARADGSTAATAPGAPLPPHGKPLGKLSQDDFKAVIEKGLIQYSMSTLLFYSFKEDYLKSLA